MRLSLVRNGHFARSGVWTLKGTKMEMRFDVLDHGYVSCIESWGSDERVIESARMSTGKGFLGWGPKTCPSCDGQSPSQGAMNEQLRNTGDTSGACDKCNNTHEVPGDEKLLRYLYENKHATPFEFGGLVIEVQAPIFVFREWHRHRTQSYNEMSARYTPLPDVNYRPTAERCIVVPGSNKQARGTSERVPTHEEVIDWLENYLEPAYAVAQGAYARGLEIGIPKEVARLPVPVARYTRMRASTNLRNWLGFLTLRMAPVAQWEIRQYANAVGQIVRENFPRTWELFAAGTV